MTRVLYIFNTISGSRVHALVACFWGVEFVVVSLLTSKLVQEVDAVLFVH